MASLSIEMEMVVPAGMPPGGGAAAVQFHALPVEGTMLRGRLVLDTTTLKPGKQVSINSKGIELFFRGRSRTAICTRNSSGETSHDETHYGGAKLFKLETHPLPQGREEHLFPAGQRFVFPFAFVVPVGLPPSQRWRFDGPGRGNSKATEEGARGCCDPQQLPMHEWASAEVKYEIRAVAHISGLFTSNLHAHQDIIIDPILPPTPVPVAVHDTKDSSSSSSSQSNVGPPYPNSESGEVQIPNICCCVCFGYKSLTGTATLPRSLVALYDGDVLPLESLALTNRTGRALTSLVMALQTAVDISVDGGRLRRVVRRATTWREVVPLQIAGGVTAEQVLQGLLVRLPASGVGLDGMAIRPPETNAPGLIVHTELLLRVTLAGTARVLNLRLRLPPPCLPPMMAQLQQPYLAPAQVAPPGGAGGGTLVQQLALVQMMAPPPQPYAPLQPSAPYVQAAAAAGPYAAAPAPYPAPAYAAATPYAAAPYAAAPYAVPYAAAAAAPVGPAERQPLLSASSQQSPPPPQYSAFAQSQAQQQEGFPQQQPQQPQQQFSSINGETDTPAVYVQMDGGAGMQQQQPQKTLL
jgi:hypothetical protein